MASYINGVSDYIPELQPFQPDFNFYQNALSTLQGRYDASHKQMSELYGKLLSSQLTHGDNIERRDKFFTDIASEIKKISGLDLAKQENVEAAFEVFKPLIDDKYFVKDLGFTKTAMKQFQKAEILKNCLDEKTCGGKYWEGGVRAVQYQMEDFAKASLEETLSFSNPSYVPNRNIQKEAMEFAKSQGYSIENLEWTRDGRYMVHTKNGAVAIPSLTDTFLGIYGEDGQVQELYRTKSYLQRKDFAKSAAQSFGSEEAAEAYYINGLSSELHRINSQKLNYVERAQEFAVASANVMSQYLSNRNGGNPNDPTDVKIAKQLEQVSQDQQILNALKNIYGQSEAAVNPESFSSVSMEDKRWRVDHAVSTSLLTNDIAAAATNYAMLTSTIKVEADPYSLANHKFALDLKKMEVQFGIDQEMEKYKTTLRMLEESYKDGGPLGKSLSADGNDIVPGGTYGGGSLENEEQFNRDFEKQKTEGDQSANATSTLARSVYDTLNNVVNARIGEEIMTPTGSIMVTQDLKTVAKTKLEQYFKADQVQVPNPDKARLEENATPKAGWGINPLFAITEGIGNLWDSMFGEEVPETVPASLVDDNGRMIDLSQSIDFLDPKNPLHYEKVYDAIANDFNSDPLLGSIFKGNQTVLQNFQAASDQIEEERLIKRVQAHNVSEAHQLTIKKLLGDPGLREDIGPSQLKAIQELYVNSNGGLRTKEEFAQEYANKYYGKPGGQYEPAPALSVGLTMLPIGKLGSRTGEEVKAKFWDKEDLYEQGEDLYETYTDYFKNVYNQTPYAITQFPNKIPVDAAQSNRAGSGLVAESFRILNNDSKFPGNTGSQDFLGLYRNLQAFKNDDRIVLGTNLDISQEGGALETSINDLPEGSREQAMRALQMIYSDIGDPSKKAKDGRAKWDATMYHAVGNDPDKVGVTFDLHPDFVAANAGSGKTPGPLNGINSISVILPKDAIAPDNQMFTRLELGKHALQMRVDKKIDVDEFEEYGGSTTIALNSNNGYTINTRFKVFDATTGQLRVFTQPANTVDDVGEGVIEALVKNAREAHYNQWQKNTIEMKMFEQFNSGK